MRRVFIALLFVFGFGAVQAQSAAIPEITFDQLLQYKTHTTDTIYVINFWATWCKPCVEELPAFEKLNQMYGGRSRVKVLLVNLDSKKNMDTRILPFIRSKELKSKVLFTDVVELNQRLEEIDPAWSGAIPATLFSGKTAAAKFLFEGQMTFEELDVKVRQLIKIK
ncbi:MAG: TlpA family protein disulfide reductase [Bacteroidia bacterium]|nr:TlpA family protein disulfide reductase [Bacteroidia bacterium]MBP7262406.1 TlpA family protein disulfide reductase [Bacteroidia bacterium]MBP9181272.1 TlpA family protein disulfide reductase [Bacteroidia bacterium]MBP9725478.1 TlpA family protein disulfide reductase [Bacteroidia bacterium]